LRQALELLEVVADDPVAADDAPGDPKARPGVLQILAFLPTTERRALLSRLTASDAPRLRALSLLANQVAEGSVEAPVLARAIEQGTPSEALLAVTGLTADVLPKVSAAIRLRLDHVDRFGAPLSPVERDLAVALAYYVAAGHDAADAKRLAAARAKVGRAGRAPGDALVAAAAAKQIAALEENRAVPRAAAAATPEPAAGPFRRWATEPLAVLLPGEGWSYFRVPRPGLLAAGILDLVRRLHPAEATDRAALQAILAAFSKARLFSLFGGDSGVDLGQPLECAREARRGMVCAIFVKDAARVRRALAEGDAGNDLALPEALAGVSMILPYAAPAFPIFIHSVIARGAQLGAHGGGTLLRERVRDQITVAGTALERDLRISADIDGGVKTDTRLFLIEGDRLLLFSSEVLARELLARTAPAGGSFADGAAYRRAAATWVDGPVVQGIWRDPGVGPRDTHTIEMAVTSSGISTRSAVTPAHPIDGDVSSVWSALPAGAASSLAWINDADAKEDIPDEDLKDDPDLGVAPPIWVGSARGAAFGWYPQPSGTLWTDWIGVASWDEPLRGRWRAHGLREPSASIAAMGKWFAVRRGGLIVLSSRRSLLERPSTSAAVRTLGPGRRWLGVGEIDFAVVEPVVRRLAARAGEDGVIPAKRMMALTAAIGKQASLSSWWDADHREVHEESSLSFQLADETPATEVIDRWLEAAPRGGAIPLPRDVTPEELARPLHLVIAGLSDEEAARTFPASGRQALERLGDARARLTLLPSPAAEHPAPAMPLDADQRKRWTDREADRDGGNRLGKLAREIVAPGRSPVEAAGLVVGWMQKNMTYEIQPNQIDPLSILDRRRGDCTEYSGLTVALLRSLGIPARLRAGFMLGGQSLVAHAWVEFHDGHSWRAIDPTNNRLELGAGYVEASVMDALSLFALHRLRIDSIE